jgi:hypothetical protein
MIFAFQPSIDVAGVIPPAQYYGTVLHELCSTAVSYRSDTTHFHLFPSSLLHLVLCSLCIYPLMDRVVYC